MRAPLLFFLQVFGLQMRAELTPVDARPLLIDGAVLAPVEVELAPVPPARGHHRMHMHMAGVSVKRIRDDALREHLALVLRHHPDHFLVAHVFMKGIQEAVEGSLALHVAPFRRSAQQLILFELPHELDEVGAKLLVRSLPVGLCDVVGHVLGPQVLHLALRPAEARVVLDATSRAAAG